MYLTMCSSGRLRVPIEPIDPINSIFLRVCQITTCARWHQNAAITMPYSSGETLIRQIRDNDEDNESRRSQCSSLKSAAELAIRVVAQ